jgi:polysaccharide deacetylase family protein (PEP-CTERM system associated)
MSGAADTATRPPLLLSVDFEDWHQLVRRRVGLRTWEAGRTALPQQTRALLDLLDELGARATFFVLGVTARRHPDLVAELAGRGHELACHGDGHQLVYRQSIEEFRSDLLRSRDRVRELTGKEPIGYRAPAFSINRDAIWAYEVLADSGFRYDASQYDTPRIPRRITPVPGEPYAISLPSGRSLWEFPVAVWRVGQRTIPVGGGTYWGYVPGAVVLRGLAAAGSHAGLYLHPHECDPERLRATLPHAATPRQRLAAGARAVQRDVARRRVPDVLRAVSERFRLIPYEEAHAELSQRPGASTRTLSQAGLLV